MDATLTLTTLAGTLLAVLALPRARRRLELSRAKHRSLAGHSRMAQRVARLLPGFAYDEARFFAADDAPAGLSDWAGAPPDASMGEPPVMTTVAIPARSTG